MQIQQINDNLFLSVGNSTWPEQINVAQAFDILTQPMLDILRYIQLTDGIKVPLAESVFYQLTDEKLKIADCRTLNKLFREVMRLVHPDKAVNYDKSLANRAAANLNNAREALGCKNDGSRLETR